MHENAPTLESVVVVQGRLPGLGMLLALPASHNPGLDGGCSACGGGAESGWVEVAMGWGGWAVDMQGHGGKGSGLEVRGDGQGVLGRAQNPPAAPGIVGWWLVLGGEMLC